MYTFSPSPENRGSINLILNSQVIFDIESSGLSVVIILNVSVVCSINGGTGDKPVPGSPGIINGPGEKHGK